MNLDLNTIWFLLVGVLFGGYAMLDGFDLGVGALTQLVRDDGERRVLYNAIGPAHEAAGFKKKMKAAFERIAAQPGVMSTVPTEKWSVHYPKALPEGDEA